MSKPTCRELLDGIKKHEEFLNDLEWSREDDCLVYMLAARVEKVLTLHAQTPTFGSMDFCWCGDIWPCQTMRLLNGEKL